ncbi:MAG TPA: hypothetical protein DCO65_08145, partial [Spartobacteria bacterium]|nr:hypothetical protein [Spartobacteria bacterium]
MFSTNDSTPAATDRVETAQESLAQIAVIDRPHAGDAAETGQETLAQRITAQLEETMAMPGLGGKIWIGSLLSVIAAAVV